MNGFDGVLGVCGRGRRNLLNGWKIIFLPLEADRIVIQDIIYILAMLSFFFTSILSAPYWGVMSVTEHTHTYHYEYVG